MPQTLLSEPINRFFYGYICKQREYIELIQNANDAYDSTVNVENLIGTIVREAFHAGARWQLRESAKLSPYISRFLEMCILLGPDSPRDVWLEATDTTPREWDIDVADSDCWPDEAREPRVPASVYADSYGELRDDIPF